MTKTSDIVIDVTAKSTLTLCRFNAAKMKIAATRM